LRSLTFLYIIDFIYIVSTGTTDEDGEKLKIDTTTTVDSPFLLSQVFALLVCLCFFFENFGMLSRYRGIDCFRSEYLFTFYKHYTL